MTFGRVLGCALVLAAASTAAGCGQAARDDTPPETVTVEGSCVSWDTSRILAEMRRTGSTLADATVQRVGPVKTATEPDARPRVYTAMTLGSVRTLSGPPLHDGDQAWTMGGTDAKLTVHAWTRLGVRSGARVFLTVRPVP